VSVSVEGFGVETPVERISERGEVSSPNGARSASTPRISIEGTQYEVGAERQAIKPPRGEAV
jgi:hypothetical protein